MRPKRASRSTTYALEGGGFLHIDRVGVPILIPKAKKCPEHNYAASFEGGDTYRCRKCGHLIDMTED